jgi:DNA-binding transcriptional regulator YiaG
MTKNFKELQAKMRLEARVRSEEAAKKMISEMGLAELREAMDLSQESLADTLHVKQASISKVERRSEMYISSLRRIIEAMGGELQIIANMPNGRVQSRQFTKIRKDEFGSAQTKDHVEARSLVRAPRKHVEVCPDRRLRPIVSRDPREVFRRFQLAFGHRAQRS